jgi:hypothetical protein
MRFEAALSAPNPSAVAEKVLAGTPINTLKDRAGKRMTDSYLKKKLAERYPWVKEVYEHTSAFIHLSEKHIFNSLHIANEEERIVLLKVGDRDAFVPQWAYLQALRFFKEITAILLGLVTAWGHLKRQHTRREEPDPA